MFVLSFLLSATLLASFVKTTPFASGSAFSSSSCDTVKDGYECDPRISHFWGQYSPFFSVPSTIPNEVPPQCHITFAQVLSRHGARFPTSSKSASYKATVEKLQKNVHSYPPPYQFLAKYKYSLGADDLTKFGQLEMIHSGQRFYQQYPALARNCDPFVRSSGEARVVESAENFTQGFHQEKIEHTADGSYPYPILVIPEGSDYNNSLDHGLCTAFEDGPDSDIADDAQGKWAKIFAEPIRTRFNQDLQGANLTLKETIYLMDLCPFETVSSTNGTISPFCNLRSEKEWHQYSYYETLGKYYGYGNGNPLGPTQGVGFVNELIARLTDKPVKDHTSTNRTLDDNPSTFPLGRELYADFSHDNDMTAVFAALGLYGGVAPLPNTTVVEAEQAGGYSAAWTVPFAARAYIEKMQCAGQKDELVRVIINDRVQPLKQCHGDGFGRCSLDAFVDSLKF